MNYLKQAVDNGATDLHLTENGEAVMRCLGQMKVLGPCDTAVYDEIEQLLLSDSFIVMKENEKVKDFSATVEGLGRLRCRAYSSQRNRAMAVRFLPQEIPSPQSLQWPNAVYNLCSLHHGLILVTGATGSGKSTTLAAMIEHINRQRACHIVTLESPVEYLFEAKRALIHQCDIPSDIPSFSEGAKAVLRMDPDIIMVGELTDTETMRAVLKLAESGHLVLATMHTASAVDAIEYFINHFDASEQHVVRYQLANVLCAVIAQRLLVHRSEEKRLAAYEVLLRNTAMVQQIKANDLSQLIHTMEVGRAEGMCILEESLANMVKSGDIRMEEAVRVANEPYRLRKYLGI